MRHRFSALFSARSTVAHASLLAIVLVQFAHLDRARAQSVEGADATVPPPPAAVVDLQAVLRGEGRGLTSSAAAERALETAPGLARARAGVRQAGANVDRALYGFIPRLELSFRYTRLSEIQQATLFSGGNMVDPSLIDGLVAGVDDPESRLLWQMNVAQNRALADFRFPIILDNFAFRASLTYPVSAVLLSVMPAYEGAQQGLRAAEHQIDSQSNDVAYNAREAFYNYARARGGLAVATIAVQQAEARQRQVEAFVRAGTVARVDELRVRAQVAATHVAVARARAGVQVTATALRTVLHLPADADIAVAEDLLAPLGPLPASPDALLAQALRERPEVRTLRALVRATEQQAVAAEGSRYPQLLLQGNLDVQNPNTRIFPLTAEFRESWDLSAIVAWSPQSLLDGEAQANEARARRDQLEADLSLLEDGIRVQVAEAATAYEAAREALEAARLGVEAAEESYRVQNERYRAGTSTINDLLDSNAEQVRAQLELVNAAIDGRLALARLARATASPVVRVP
jgi:outer membrane protein TolC